MVPELWSEHGGRDVDPGEVALALAQAEDVEGLTVTGGEPFEQAKALAELLSLTKRLGKNTWVYSGFTLEDLASRADPDTDRALAHVDVLVDGPYNQGAAGTYRFRGSANQRIIAISGAIPTRRIEVFEGAAVEVTVGPTGQLLIIGVPPPGFFDGLRDALDRRGIRLGRLTV